MVERREGVNGTGRIERESERSTVCARANESKIVEFDEVGNLE